MILSRIFYITELYDLLNIFYSRVEIGDAAVAGTCDEIAKSIHESYDKHSYRRSLQLLERAAIRQQFPGESPHLLRGVLQTAGRFSFEEIEIW